MAIDKSLKQHYEMQGKVRNYLGKQKMVKAPKKWKSAPHHPETELAYITKAEKDALIKMNMYGSMNGKANKGPSGIISLNGGDPIGGYGPGGSWGGGSGEGGGASEKGKPHWYVSSTPAPKPEPKVSPQQSMAMTGDPTALAGKTQSEAQASVDRDTSPTRSRIQDERQEDVRKKQMQDLIVQQQQEKDYIDIIDKNYATDFDETPEATLQGQLKLDEYKEPNPFIDKAIGFGLNMIIPGSGFAYNAPFNPYKASNFFAGTGIQNLDQNALLSGYVSPEDAAAYQAGTYGQPTGGEGPPPVTGGGGQDVMPITTAQAPPVLPAGGINTLSVDPTLTAGYTDQQDFLDNIYRENLLDFFKGTGYTGLYG